MRCPTSRHLRRALVGTSPQPVRLCSRAAFVWEHVSERGQIGDNTRRSRLRRPAEIRMSTALAISRAAIVVAVGAIILFWTDEGQ